MGYGKGNVTAFGEPPLSSAAGIDARRHGAEALLLKYIRAKDGNRPHVLRGVFAEGARLEMAVQSDNIDFPPAVESSDAIIDILIRQFAAKYENVYTFYLQRPPVGERINAFTCRWLVGMTDKETGTGRVGTGTYHWQFSDSTPMYVTGLRIDIECMEIVPAEACLTMLDWIASLPYPWSNVRDVLRYAPQLDALRPVHAALRQCDATSLG
ncbi:MAG TPA: hypothetical protein VF798_10015 [Burkholderiaceae bacterium]